MVESDYGIIALHQQSNSMQAMRGVHFHALLTYLDITIICHCYYLAVVDHNHRSKIKQNEPRRTGLQIIAATNEQEQKQTTDHYSDVCRVIFICIYIL